MVSLSGKACIRLHFLALQNAEAFAHTAEELNSMHSRKMAKQCEIWERENEKKNDRAQVRTEDLIRVKDT